MRLLVLGGSGFLGHHVVAEAVAAGHEVTAANREGRVAVGGVEVVRADRSRPGGLDALRGGTWDAMVDTLGDPDAVGAAADALADAVGTSAYVSIATAGRPLPPGALRDRSAAKLDAEHRVVAAFGRARTLVVRPAILVGPRDPTDRFTYWPMRMLRALRDPLAREVLVPGDPARPVQHTDARDLAAWIVRMLAAGRAGTFDAVGPLRRESLHAVLDACLAAAAEHEGVTAEAAGVSLVAHDEDRLRRALADVAEERRPLWFPEDSLALGRVDATAAAHEGLAFRPVRATARDTLAWALETDVAPHVALGPAWERSLLAGRT